MEFTKITVREWLTNYKNGEYNNGDRNTMCKAGWWDWFCSDEALLGRLHRIAGTRSTVSILSAAGHPHGYAWFFGSPWE